MKRYFLSVAAENDRDEIVDYLLEHASKEVALKVNNRIEAAIKKIAKNPEIGHLRNDLADAPVRFWLVDSFMIIYLIEDSCITVVRILHSKRDIKAIIGDA